MRSITLTGANQLVTSTPRPVVYYRGITVRETTGVSYARLRIYDNTAAAGTILDEITLAPNESTREDYGDPCPTAKVGLYIEIASGAVAGSIRID